MVRGRGSTPCWMRRLPLKEKLGSRALKMTALRHWLLRFFQGEKTVKEDMDQWNKI
jgi:hypothetical protein